MKVVIDGNIGCGKTTIIKRLNDDIRIPIFLEPLHRWNDLLTLFYKDPQKWSFPFNLEVLLTFNEWKNNNFPAVYERSPLSCKYVFSQQNYESGHIHHLENEIFNKIYEQLSWTPDVLIYIKTDPAMCFERMQKRARNCESEVSMDYLKAIDKKYTEYTENHVSQKYTLHVINGNRDKDDVYNDVLQIIKSYVP